MEKLYITFDIQLTSEYVADKLVPNMMKWVYKEGKPLGFACATNKKGEFKPERIKRQMDWAYGDHKVVNGIVYSNVQYSSQRHDIHPCHPNNEFRYQPMEVNNEPLAGFTIESVATRYTTSNKLFRIGDPRGFQLEISADNLLELIGSCIIEKGEIKDKCKWDFGKNGIGKAKLIKSDS